MEVGDRRVWRAQARYTWQGVRFSIQRFVDCKPRALCCVLSADPSWSACPGSSPPSGLMRMHACQFSRLRRRCLLCGVLGEEWVVYRGPKDMSRWCRPRSLCEPRREIRVPAGSTAWSEILTCEDSFTLIFFLGYAALLFCSSLLCLASGRMVCLPVCVIVRVCPFVCGQPVGMPRLLLALHVVFE